MRKIKPDIDKEQLINNPLTQTNFQILVNKSIIDNSFKVVEGGIKIPQEINYDVERYCKLFNNPDSRKSVSLLSNKAKSLLFWIMFELDAGRDYLWINKDRYKKENLVMDDRTYTLAIIELVRYLFIQPTIYENTYWINPRLFFSGSRINKYPDKITYVNSPD